MHRGIFCVLACFLATTALAAPIYKCKDEKGNVVFTDKKCDADAKQLRVWDSHLGDVDYPATFSGSTPDEVRAGMRARSGVGRSVADREVRDRCAAQWPGDYRMTEYCIQKQASAAAAMQPVFDRAERDKDLQLIVGRCAQQWQEGKTYDYAMVKYCYEQQQGARERLGK